jgi:phosphohistidine phosphatase
MWQGAQIRMDLILWRHAEAEEGEPDLERRLTAKGRKQAERVAAWLQQRLPTRFVFVASPARRTCQTADALALPYKTSDKLLPGGSPDEALAASGWPDKKGAVLIVGHQPTLGRVAARLLAGRDEEWTIKKGGLWWLNERDREDGSQVVVRAVITPDLL